MLFLQAINNILFDEKKLTALLIRISDARVASLDVLRKHPVEFVCPKWYLIKQRLPPFDGRIRHYRAKKNNMGVLLYN